MENQRDLHRLLAHMHREIVSGLHHGFFEYSLIGEIKNGKRHVILKAGKTYKFTLLLEDIREREG